MVNAQWLTDILCGQMHVLHQFDGPKYQQFSPNNPFKLEYALVPHLMGITFTYLLDYYETHAYLYIIYLKLNVIIYGALSNFLILAAWKMPINITQESYDKVKQVGQGPNSIRKYKKPRLDGPLLNKDPHLLGLDEPIVISNPDPPPPDKQPRILFSGINPKNHAKV